MASTPGAMNIRALMPHSTPGVWGMLALNPSTPRTMPIPEVPMAIPTLLPNSSRANTPPSLRAPDRYSL